jgi:hypothetical protein
VPVCFISGLLIVLQGKLDGGHFMFSSLDAVKKLQEVGVPREHAEAYVGVLMEIRESNIATKQDLRAMETRLLSEIGRMRYGCSCGR